MGAAKKLEMLPEEKFIQDALRDGRAFRTEISLKAIGKPDVRFQARVDPLDIDHVNRLGRILEEQGALHPIVVFYNPKTKKYLVADGFHRHDTYRRAKRDSIPAYQIEGDERDALEYCTMCNRLAMKGRTKEDVNKAIEMLLADEVWWGRADAWVADHIGCDPYTAKRIRSRMVVAGKTEPQEVATRHGRCAPYKYHRGREARRISPAGGGGLAASVGGKKVLGRSPEAVADKVAALMESAENRRICVSRHAISCRLTCMGFVAVLPPSGIRLNLGWYRVGVACTQCDFASPGSLFIAIGQLVAVRQIKEPGVRAVVLCYREDGPATLITLYEQAGFEFMTPEELAESLKTEESEAI